MERKTLFTAKKLDRILSEFLLGNRDERQLLGQNLTKSDACTLKVQCVNAQMPGMSGMGGGMGGEY